MKLKKIWINKYKNLENFKISFKEGSKLDFIVGKNGCGKSNLFEAIIKIFLYLEDRDKLTNFSFEIEYSLQTGEDLKFEYDSSNNSLKKNNKEIKIIQKKYLPKNIYRYYAGKNDKIFDDFNYSSNEKLSLSDFNKRKRRENFFVQYDSKYNDIFSLIYFSDEKFDSSEIISNFDLKEIVFEFKKPYFSKEIKNWDEVQEYQEKQLWGVDNYISDFFKELYHVRDKNTDSLKKGFFSNEQKYYLHISSDDLKKLVNKYGSEDFFKLMVEMKNISLLSKINFKINNDNIENIDYLSEGQIQSLFMNFIFLFNDEDNLFLFDEIDSFLHPELQNKIHRIHHKKEFNNQILFITHQPSTILNVPKDNVYLIEENKCFNCDKRKVMKELSEGLVEYDYNRALLSIIEELSSTTKPILLCEGHSDPIILEKAWKKLYPQEEMPFNSFYCIGKSNLRVVLQDEKVLSSMNNNTLMALFDFDEAYNEWNSLKGKQIETDPFKCLTKKVESEKHTSYALLLPLNKNKDLEPQIFEDISSKRTYKSNSRFSIELMFYDYISNNKDMKTNIFFKKKDVSCGGKEIHFCGNKIEFANSISKFDIEAFSGFKILFEKIKSII